jgi:multiple antibiotic resistance protein
MRPVMTTLSAAIVLFLVMDPLGNIVLFVTALRSVPAARRKRVVVRELLIAYGVLIVFLFTGEHLLHVLNISGPALTIAGGIVLFLIALRMVFPSSDNTMAENIKGEPFLVPLAIPYVAGPSTLATLLLLMSREPQRWREWLLALSCAWLASAIILVLGGYIGEFLGRRGLLALERLMGLLLVALAVQMSIEGLRVALGTPA